MGNSSYLIKFGTLQLLLVLFQLKKTTSLSILTDENVGEFKINEDQYLSYLKTINVTYFEDGNFKNHTIYANLSIMPQLVNLCNIGFGDPISPYALNNYSKNCVEFAHQLCFKSFGVAYTPLLERSSLQELLIMRFNIIDFLAKKYNSKSYLEIGCDDDISFDHLRSTNNFDLMVGVDPVSYQYN